LPNGTSHLQIKKRSENFGRVQVGTFDDVINVYGFVGAEEFVKLLFEGIEGSRDQEISLSGFELFGFYESGADGSGEFFDYVFGVGGELLGWAASSARTESRVMTKRSASACEKISGGRSLITL
jgi:hypothetical protein